MLLYHANCSFTDFGGKLVGFVHGSILSRIRASSKPGAIQVASTVPASPDLQGLRALYHIGVNPANFNGNTPVQSEFLHALEQVRSAHMERLDVRQSHLATTKLVIIFMFGVLTQFAIALCHAGNVRATWASVMLFSIAFAATMWVLTAFEDPQKFATLISDRIFVDVH
jgi:hypothetical protein